MPRVLAARRTTPEALAGGWEFPGGKVDPGESEEQAAVREIREELGCGAVVTGRLSGVVPVRPGLDLVVLLGRIVEGDPVPHEHDLIRWLRADELDQVRWLPADLPFVEELGEVLR